MSETHHNPSPGRPDLKPAPDDAPDAYGKFSLSEDWLAVIVGLLLLSAALLGLIPEGLVP